jgi:hypothetical protein
MSRNYFIQEQHVFFPLLQLVVEELRRFKTLGCKIEIPKIFRLLIQYSFSGSYAVNLKIPIQFLKNLLHGMAFTSAARRCYAQ